jgi:hypothetical protein
MRKEFNINGSCNPDKHYMANVSKKLDAIMKLVEKGAYFIINRPRQYGKTATLFTIQQLLLQNKNYAVISLSFEGVGDAIFQAEEQFVPSFIDILANKIKNWRKESLAVQGKKIFAVWV